MTIWEAEGVGIEDAINEAAATAAVTVGVFERSRGLGTRRSTRGSDLPRNSSSLESISGGAWVDGVSAGESGTRLSQAGAGLASVTALAAAAVAVLAATAICASSSATRDRAARTRSWPAPNAASRVGRAR